MCTYLMSLQFDIWKSIVTWYTIPKTPPIDNTGKKASEHNAKATSAILCGLSESKFSKVMHCESEKNIWEKLQNIYEGDDKVKKEKLQTHKDNLRVLK
jgi:hypothetical protein